MMLVLTMSAVLAQSQFALTWNVPCAPVPDVTAVLHDATGEAVVTVVPRSGRWRLEVVFLRPDPGARTLDTDTCEEAVKAVPLLLKLGAAPETSPVPRSSPPPSTAAAPVAVAPVPRSSAHVTVAVGAGLNVGGSPAAAPRFSLTVGAAAPLFAVFASVRAGAPATFAGALDTDSAFVLRPALGGQLAGCVLPSLGRVRLGACLALTTEWWLLEGVNVDRPRSGAAVTFVVGPALHASVQLTDGVFLFGTVSAGVAIRRLGAQFEGAPEPTFVSSLISGEATAGLGWQWPTE